MLRNTAQMDQTPGRNWRRPTIGRIMHQLLVAGAIVSAAACMKTPSDQVLITNPVKLPDPHVPGYVYPETQATILKHVNAGDQAWIDNHAWGLWTALTTEVLPGVRVYETWQSPTPGGVLSPGPLSGSGATQAIHRVHQPRQFHGRRFDEDATEAGLPSTSNQVLVTVNWSPEMVADVIGNDYLSSAKLKKLLGNKQTGITLNNRSVSLKPTYLWMGSPLLADNRYYQLSVWPGPPNPAIPFPSNLWGRCVWIDTKDQSSGTGTGASDTTCSSSSRTAETTYGLGSLIHYRLTAQEAAEWNKEGIKIKVGGKTYEPKIDDLVILIAMHVGSREMTEWTWQTFWWQPDPDNPPAPSSRSAAAARPAALKGAARHYAQCTAYQMVTPNQPMTGGTGTKPLLCYSPYLEAPFTHNSDLPDSKPWTYQGTRYDLNVGVQTNCMSCHLQAAYPQNSASPGYTADRYIDLDAAEFINYLQLDFSWSIVQNVK